MTKAQKEIAAILEKVVRVHSVENYQKTSYTTRKGYKVFFTTHDALYDLTELYTTQEDSRVFLNADDAKKWADKLYAECLTDDEIQDRLEHSQYQFMVTQWGYLPENLERARIWVTNMLAIREFRNFKTR